MIFTSDAILLAIAILVNAAIGLYVFVHDPENRQHQAFCTFVLGGVCWSLGILLLLATHDFAFDKLAHYGALLGIGGLVWFAQIFPKPLRVLVRPHILYAPLWIAGITIAPWNFVIDHIKVLPNGTIDPVPGTLYGLWAGILLSYALLAIGIFIWRLRHSQGEERMRIQYFFLGTSTFVFCALLFDAVLPAFLHVPHLIILGPLSSVCFITCTAYAIIRHQLLDIRIVLQRGIIYSLLLAGITTLYIFILVLSKDIFDEMKWIDPLISAEATILIGIGTVPYLERTLRRKTDRFFFKDPYDYGSALESLSSAASAHITVPDLAERLLETLSKILHPEFSIFWHAKSDSYFGDIPAELGMIATETVFELPLESHGELLGRFMLGRKRSGDSYSPEDVRLLRTFAAQAAVAFHKAELYEELREYSHSLEDKVRERTKDLLTLQTQQRQLFHDLSHALQTPVTVLQSILELQRETLPNTRESELAEQSIKTIAGLIRDIFKLARIDSLPEDAPLERINLSELVAEVAEYADVICRAQCIQLESSITPDMYVLGEVRQLQETVRNLLSNAVQYTIGCKKKQVRLSLSPQGNEILLFVSDTGIGIAADELSHVFDRFYRAGNSQERTGNGLGLAIVKSIVTRHGGRIEVTSKPEVGTTFTVYLPRI